MINADTKQLKDFLIDSGVISRSGYDEIENQIRKSKCRDSVEKVLVSLGRISEDDLRKATSYAFGVPFVFLKGLKMDFSALSVIPEPICRKHNIVSYSKDGEFVEVAALDLKDLSAIDFLKDKGIKILPRITDSESIRQSLIQYQKYLKTEYGDFIQKNISNEDQILKVVETLLRHAILQNSSDIHIECAEENVLVRYRIGGNLHDALILPKIAAESIFPKIKSLSNMREGVLLPQSGRFKTNIDGEDLFLKVSFMPTRFGEKAVVKVKGGSGHSLESLGFYGQNLEKIYGALAEKSGLILVSGPKKSGKTSTLYSMLEFLNRPDVNIATIEDPVEYQIPRINQTQVKEKIGLTFSNGFRSIMKQDPDVIMIGEIKDNETAALSAGASLAGKMVLAGISANSAFGAVNKLLQMKVEKFIAYSAVKLVISQRLVKKLSDDKVKYNLSKSEISSLAKMADLDKVLRILKEEGLVGPNDDWKNIYFYKSKNDSYSGKIGIYEVVIITSAIRELFMKDLSFKEVEKEFQVEGNLTAVEDGIIKCVLGLTSLEEVMKSEL